MRSSTIGHSVQNRDIVLYELSPAGNVEVVDSGDVPVVLFLSLVHGNEVMGLLALLRTVEIITKPDALPQRPVRILLVPFVNIDAYTLNREAGQGGCRRTNLRPTCDSADTEDATSCTAYIGGGVDLNRNHPGMCPSAILQLPQFGDAFTDNLHVCRLTRWIVDCSGLGSPHRHGKPR